MSSAPDHVPLMREGLQTSSIVLKLHVCLRNMNVSSSHPGHICLHPLESKVEGGPFVKPYALNERSSSLQSVPLYESKKS